MTFNGWTNYETWRVNLEFFDGRYESFTADSAKELAEYYIDETTEPGFARDLALAFLSQVNWQEIAAHYQEEPEQ
jgi:hypothetical protein